MTLKQLEALVWVARLRSFRAAKTEELRRAYMPPMLHYLACIESGYRIDARSRFSAF